jgi:hypothetical protein
MAIRGHQVVDPYTYDLSCTMVTEGEMGGCAVLTGTGSFTTGMDQSNKIVGYASNPSGKYPAGVLLHTVEDYDTSKIPQNFQNHNVVPVNSKVTLVRKFRGRVNNLVPASTGAMAYGVPAYVGANGNYTTVSTSGYPRAGRFESGVDTDGFVEISVNID